jgi:hypothetical protein
MPALRKFGRVVQIWQTAQARRFVLADARGLVQADHRRPRTLRVKPVLGNHKPGRIPVTGLDGKGHQPPDDVSIVKLILNARLQWDTP